MIYLRQHPMRTQTFQKLAVLWLALWFGVIVPGHKRGLVLLPDGKSQAPAAKQAAEKPCPLAQIMGTNGSCCCQPSRKSSDDNPGAPVTHCAICYLTGVLDVPLPPDFAPRPLELAQMLPWPEPVAVDSIPASQTYLGRAPPIV